MVLILIMKMILIIILILIMILTLTMVLILMFIRLYISKSDKSLSNVLQIYTNLWFCTFQPWPVLALLLAKKRLGRTKSTIRQTTKAALPRTRSAGLRRLRIVDPAGIHAECRNNTFYKHTLYIWRLYTGMHMLLMLMLMILLPNFLWLSLICCVHTTGEKERTSIEAIKLSGLSIWTQL